MAWFCEVGEGSQNLMDSKPQKDNVTGPGQSTISPGGQSKERCWVHLSHEHSPGGSTKGQGVTSQLSQQRSVLCTKPPALLHCASGGTEASAVCPISATLGQLSPHGHFLLPDLERTV